MQGNVEYNSLEETTTLLLNTIIPSFQEEVCSLSNALGRVLAQEIYAPISQPPFNRTPMDGYAVRSADIVRADKQHPITLKVIEKIFAGTTARHHISQGEAIRVFTGAPIPEGADCVVRQEDTDYGTTDVAIYQAGKQGQNICYCGEDIKAGKLCIPRGEKLDAVKIGILAMLGIAEISVYKQINVGLLTTGDELININEELSRGKIYDSNLYLLSSRLRELGCIPYIVPRHNDALETLAEDIEKTLQNVDMLITTGGVSVGEKDYMPLVCRNLNGSIIFKGVKMKPGSPAMAFTFKGKPVLCLSGNPFAAATFELLARPIISFFQGIPLKKALLPRTSGYMRTAFSKASPGRRLIRGKIEGENVYLPLGGEAIHSSGILSSMMGCNCMVDIPAGSSALKIGQKVDVILL